MRGSRPGSPLDRAPVRGRAGRVISKGGLGRLGARQLRTEADPGRRNLMSGTAEAELEQDRTRGTGAGPDPATRGKAG